MKIILTLLIWISLFSCSTKKIELPSKQKIILVSNISSVERTILNEFLNNELKSDKYSFNNEVIIIDEAIPTIKNIEVYQSAYVGYHRYNKPSLKDNNRLGWVMDYVQIMKLKRKKFTTGKSSIL